MLAAAKAGLWPALAAFLAACAGPVPRAPEGPEPLPAPEPVPVLRATEALDPGALLDVTIEAFDPGLPPDAVRDPARELYPKLRQVEAAYLPHLLRDTLRWTNQWGAVRVLPESDPSAELTISGTVLASSATRLEVAVEARDATGRRWIDRVYRTGPSVDDYGVVRGPVPEPFQHFYNRLANDLLAVREALSAPELARIREVAELRYAAALAPEAYGDYFERRAGGEISLKRLPARNDALLARIRRVREAEYLYIDTVDEHYRQIGLETRRPYYFWRSYSYASLATLEGYRDASAQERRGKRRSYREMRDRYFEFRELKLQQQTLDELADALDREVTPAVFEIEGTVLELSGTLDEQYAQWRRLLREIYARESGLPPEGP